MTSTLSRSGHSHSDRYPTREELRYIASRLLVRAIERYTEPASHEFLRQQVTAWRLGLDEFDLRDALAELVEELEMTAVAVQNRENRLVSDGRMVVPDKPRT